MVEKQRSPAEQEFQKVTAAHSALQQYSKQYGLRLTDDAASKVMDTAIKSQNVTASVKNQLYTILTRTNPTAATQGDISYYKHQGYTISPEDERTALDMTKIKPGEDGRAAWANASKFLREHAKKEPGEAGAQAKSEESGASPASKKKAVDIEKAVEGALSLAGPNVLRYYKDLLEEAKYQGSNVTESGRVNAAIQILKTFKSMEMMPLVSATDDATKHSIEVQTRAFRDVNDNPAMADRAVGMLQTLIPEAKRQDSLKPKTSA